MPIIPRIQPQPLANVPKPVLDRNARPSVERANAKIQQAIGGVIQATKPSYMPESVAAGWEGLGRFGAQVAQTGNILNAVAQAQEEATTYRQRFEAKTAMNVLSGEFEQFKAANINSPEKWLPWWQENMPQGIEKVLSNPDLTPRARDMIRMESESYAKLGALEVNKTALQKTFSLAADANKAEVAMHVNDGSYDGAMQAFEYGLKNGFRFPYEKPILERSIAENQVRKRAEAENAQERALYLSEDTVSAGDPLKWREENQPESPKWKGRETLYFKLKASNDRYLSDRTADAADYAVNQIYTNQMVTPEQVDRLTTDKTYGRYYSPQLLEKLKGAVGQWNEKQQEEQRQSLDENGVPNWMNSFAKINNAINAYTPQKDPDLQQYMMLKAAIASEVGTKNGGILSDVLYAKARGREVKPPAGKEAQWYINNRLNDIFNADTGIIPWKDRGVTLNTKAGYTSPQDSDSKVAGKPKWIPEDDRVAKAKAEKERAKMMQKMNEWLQLNPGKANNIDAIEQQFKALKPEPAMDEAYQQMLKKSKPQASATDAIRSFAGGESLSSTLPDGLKPHAQDFIDAGRQYGLNPKVLASISALETAGGTSSAFRNKRNAMGISDNSGPVEQSSVRDSIFTMAKLLASNSGPYAKAKTLDEIGAIYAPVGAANDPRGTNGGWSEGVRAWMARL